LGWKKVRGGVKVKGVCVSHEVDLIAEKKKWKNCCRNKISQ
jgi:hypothetical protein